MLWTVLTNRLEIHLLPQTPFPLATVHTLPSSHRLHSSANLSVHTVSGRWQTDAQRAPAGGTLPTVPQAPVCFVYRTLHKCSCLGTYRGSLHALCVCVTCWRNRSHDVLMWSPFAAARAWRCCTGVNFYQTDLNKTRAAQAWTLQKRSARRLWSRANVRLCQE